MQYHFDANANDVDHLINDVFSHDTPLVSPRKITSVESNMNEISNMNVTVNTSNMDTNITNDEISS